jgi:hypothetical protein
MSNQEERLPLPAPSKVLLAIPNTGYIHKHTVIAIINIMRDTRAKTTLIMPSHSPTTDNRHRIVKDFLDGDYDFLISIDSDNPPRNNVLDLVFLNLDIIGCPTPVWANKLRGGYPIYWNALNIVGDGFLPRSVSEDDGLVEVDAVGAGCLVIARRVLEKVKQPFADRFNDFGFRDMGHDYLFCVKAKEAGFKVFTHYKYPCMHFNEIEIGEIAGAFSDYNAVMNDDILKEHTVIRDGLNYDDFSIDKVDWNTLYKLVRNMGIRRILEYGSGVSTTLFRILATVDTIETNSVLAEKYSAVKCPSGWYDLAFIDGPVGTPSFSRESSVVEAMKHTGCIIMHDTNRVGERQTIQKYLSSWISTNLGSKRGMIMFRNTNIS